MGNRLTLGITTLGDLLLKNRITKTDNGNALDGIKLTIPEYQRPYKWTAKNANQLLDDIEDAMNSNKEIYRVGLPTISSTLKLSPWYSTNRFTIGATCFTVSRITFAF